MKAFLSVLTAWAWISTQAQLITCNPWYNLTNGQLPEGLYGAGFAQIDQSIYTTGGRGQLHPTGTNAVFVIDMPSQTVKPLANLPVTLVFPETVAYGADLFVLGGSTSFDASLYHPDGKSKSSNPRPQAGPLSAAVYQSTLGDTPWKRVGELPRGVWAGCAVTFNDRIYYAGGSNEEPAFGGIATVLSYKIDGGSIQSLAPMNVPRFHPSCVRFGRFIYVLGGESTPNKPLKSIERYDPRTNTWTMMNGTLTTPRLGAAAMVWENTIMVQGGWNAQVQGVSTVDVYDPVSDSTFGAPPLYQPLARVATGVLEEHLIYTGLGINVGSVSSQIFERRYCALA